MSVLLTPEGNSFRTSKLFHGAQIPGGSPNCTGGESFLAVKNLLNRNMGPDLLPSIKMHSLSETTVALRRRDSDGVVP